LTVVSGTTPRHGLVRLAAVGDLSAHFSSHEFGDRTSGDFPQSVAGRVAHLVDHLESLRSICGDVPLRILSGYRSPATNAAVGGASRSQHIYGRAADIPSGYATVDQAEEAGFTGIGEADGWAVHVDVRPGGAARWSY